MICDNCADLNLKAALDATHLAGNGRASSKRNPSAKWVWFRSKSCDFCQFWWALVKEKGSPEYPLRWMKLFPQIVFTSQYENPEPIFELVCYRDLQNNRPSTSGVLIGRAFELETKRAAKSKGNFRVVPLTIQHQMLKLLDEKLNCCRNTHSVCSSKYQINISPVIAMRVIDCRYRKIISAPKGCQYLALSYVWGEKKHSKQPDNQPLTSLPQTIEYSIVVTLKLRFQYLWVDVYCIKQDDVLDFHTQIRQMDRIHSGAEITIIAAAGTGPSRGLPGISSVRQGNQADGSLDGIYVVGLFDRP